MAIQQTPQLEEALRKAADLGASDVHLVPDEPVVFRVHGKLQRDSGDPLTADGLRAIAVAAIGEEAVGKIATQSGKVTTSCGIPGVIDGQLTIAQSMGNCTLTILVLPGIVLTAEQTGAPEALVKAVEADCGIVVVGGVVGSGKTTTAISLVDHINATRPVHILTAENPVCARLVSKQGLVQQREIGTDVPGAIEAMRSALQQDLDVFYLSELRTQAELEGIITLAETGHLVIVSAHGATPEDIIQRFVEVFTGETRPIWTRRFAQMLRAVSVQKLLRNASGKGRVAAYAVLTPDDETREAMLKGDDLRKRSKPLPKGCQTLADHIRRLEKEGLVTKETAEEALAACD
jgi:twitching motility protein PilT